MVDLERLRAMRVMDFDSGILPCPLSRAAADEIETLRQRVAEAHQLLGETQEFCLDPALEARIKAWRDVPKSGGG